MQRRSGGHHLTCSPPFRAHVYRDRMTHLSSLLNFVLHYESHLRFIQPLKISASGRRGHCTPTQIQTTAVSVSGIHSEVTKIRAMNCICHSHRWPMNNTFRLCPGVVGGRNRSSMSEKPEAANNRHLLVSRRANLCHVVTSFILSCILSHILSPMLSRIQSCALSCSQAAISLRPVTQPFDTESCQYCSIPQVLLVEPERSAIQAS
jgi:hypothetical protein